MSNYRKSSHVIYDNKYHIIWVPKYRYSILTGKVALRVRELIRQISIANEVEILSGSVGSDHIHIHVSIPPQLSVSKYVQFVKGATSHKLQLEFSEIRKRYWGQHVWARGYFCATTEQSHLKQSKTTSETRAKSHRKTNSKLPAWVKRTFSPLTKLCALAHSG